MTIPPGWFDAAVTALRARGVPLSEAKPLSVDGLATLEHCYRMGMSAEAAAGRVVGELTVVRPPSACAECDTGDGAKRVE